MITMKIAVVGSRIINDREFVFSILDKHIKNTDTIISGEARGIDTLAKEYAKLNNISYVGFPPHNGNFKYRNQQIANECDICLAFPHKSSRGTWDTINRCRKLHKEIKIF
jgi:predicted Rossmann fold nucleotide-binding protein DprA/Smf involved in DNA uptake